MKWSASPCLLDQISVIALKNCPYLRKQLWRFISKAWKNALFPKTWGQGIIILIHKKDSNKNPGNFRPITLQPILSKFFTRIIGNRIFAFVLQKKYIETNLQKGFRGNVSGCIEYTETLTYVINHAPPWFFSSYKSSKGKNKDFARQNRFFAMPMPMLTSMPMLMPRHRCRDFQMAHFIDITFQFSN